MCEQENVHSNVPSLTHRILNSKENGTLIKVCDACVHKTV